MNSSRGRRPVGAGRLRHRLPRSQPRQPGRLIWAGAAGILATFDTDLTNVEPNELPEACHSLAQRFEKV